MWNELIRTTFSYCIFAFDNDICCNRNIRNVNIIRTHGVTEYKWQLLISSDSPVAFIHSVGNVVLILRRLHRTWGFWNDNPNGDNNNRLVVYGQCEPAVRRSFKSPNSRGRTPLSASTDLSISCLYLTSVPIAELFSSNRWVDFMLSKLLIRFLCIVLPVTKMKSTRTCQLSV